MKNISLFLSIIVLVTIHLGESTKNDVKREAKPYFGIRPSQFYKLTEPDHPGHEIGQGHEQHGNGNGFGHYHHDHADIVPSGSSSTYSSYTSDSSSSTASLAKVKREAKPYFGILPPFYKVTEPDHPGHEIGQGHEQHGNGNGFGHDHHDHADIKREAKPNFGIPISQLSQKVEPDHDHDDNGSGSVVLPPFVTLLSFTSDATSYDSKATSYDSKASESSSSDSSSTILGGIL